MRKLIDLTGNIYGRLTVIKLAPKTDKVTKWVCGCVCGTIIIVCGSNLKTNITQSCGCINIEHGQSNWSARDAATREYRTWNAMKQRCLNKDTKSYKNYGGRGISVCDRWLNSFKAFYEDMGERPPNTSIDRINNDGNYEPGNCRWATASEQNYNQRRSKKHKL